MKTRSFLPILCLFLLCLPCLDLAESKAQKGFTLPPIEAFIAKWSTSGGSELGSSQTFLLELCDLLDVPRPEAPRPNLQDTSYLFEKAVGQPTAAGKQSTGRVDLYKRGCFIWESKQGSARRTAQDTGPWRSGTAARETRGWDEAMKAAKVQAEKYARALPLDEGHPPFIIAADIGYSLEIYADFNASGVYTPFPSAREYRLSLDDLRRPEILERLRQIWTNPLSLDPSRENEKVTQTIALQLSALAKSLEATEHNADTTSLFMLRCIFVMFAEDVGLLPHNSFTRLLEELRPDNFASTMTELWEDMTKGGYSSVVSGKLLRVRASLFGDMSAPPLDHAQLNLLRRAAKANWSAVDTSIFGTLLEHALTLRERYALGAHYTPTVYVERLVLPTLIEPLREEWSAVKERALAQVLQGNMPAATTEVEAFYQHLSQVTVLDPSCGSGNFLAVSLNLLKDLEDEVVQALRDLGKSDRAIRELGYAVGPHQFKGVEIVPRAAAISELVLWISALQRHYKIHGNVSPPENLLQPTASVESRDAVLAWNEDETGRPANPWPQADFIVGNPPFVGSNKMRVALGDHYTEQLRKAYPEIPKSADYVMYFWKRAASLVQEEKVKRFGLITTSGIRQMYNRRVIDTFLRAEPPLSLMYAIPDHPWIAAKDGAQVRIAMTVAERGKKEGVLAKIAREKQEGASVAMNFTVKTGIINANLSIGADTGKAVQLKANMGICSVGIQLNGAGFIITPEQARDLGLGTVPGLEQHICPYRNGRDIATRSRNVLVIDLYGLSLREVEKRYSEVYDWVLTKVKPERDTNRDKNIRENWWLFGNTGPKLRLALQGLNRYIATPTTARRRYFVFLDQQIVSESTTSMALDDAFYLGVLSSRFHQTWAMAVGSRLGAGNDPRYSKSVCFDQYPFPDATEAQKIRIRDLAERLDAHRKARQAMHPKLTLTGMYTVLEQAQRGAQLSPKEQKIFEQADIATLKALHEKLDTIVAEAYGWSPDLTDEEILASVLELNKLRAAEENAGIIRWLRPEFQKGLL